MKNKEPNLDRLIKEHLQQESAQEQPLERNQSCPSELELSDCLEQQLAPQKQQALLEHIANCKHCLSLLELAQRAKQKFKDIPPQRLIDRAQQIGQAKSSKATLKFKWSILATVCFILSFVVTRYFLQFLILAVIFSLKWIFDTGSTRTLIMIYQAWRKKDQSQGQRIIRDFQDKIDRRV